MSPGKRIYKIAFGFFSFLAKSTTGIDADIWYRNSLLQDYFCFGKSDIDVTVLLKNDDHACTQAEQISSKLHLCPLIKEILFYAPFSLRLAPQLINYYELKKDIHLNKEIQSMNSTRADQFVYLLRMFFANIHQNEFTKRDNEKWLFHLSLVGILPQKEMTSREELLSLIVSSFDSAFMDTVVYAYTGFKNKVELFDLYSTCPDRNKEILYQLFPHHFCFVDITIRHSSFFLEEIFLSQLSWELWAFITQPYLLKKEGPGKPHLKNIEKALQTLPANRLLGILKEIESAIERVGC